MERTWKECSSPNSDAILGLDWKDWWKPRKYSVMIAGIPVDFPNWSIQRYLRRPVRWFSQLNYQTWSHVRHLESQAREYCNNLHNILSSNISIGACAKHCDINNSNVKLWYRMPIPTECWNLSNQKEERGFLKMNPFQRTLLLKYTETYILGGQ
jgi:hypothetical protein